MLPRAVDLRLRHAGWTVSEWGAIRGTVFVDSRALRADEAIGLAADSLRSGSFAATVGRWNGFFAVVAWDESEVGLAVDRARSIPLFFATGPSVSISDSADVLRRSMEDRSLDAARSTELLLAGFVLNDATICRGIRQVRSGEALELRLERGGMTWTSRSLDRRVFRPGALANGPAAECAKSYGAVLEGVFARALAAARGREIVVPLSGGYDSRLVLLMLARGGAERVVTYTYGTNAGEVGRSRQIAKALGVPWHVCDYSPAAWREEASGGAFWDFVGQASDLTSVACIQEWLAVKQLKAQGRVAADAVFMPGYTADVLAGSFQTSIGERARSKLVSRAALRSLLWRGRLSAWPNRRLAPHVAAGVEEDLDASIDALEPVRTWRHAYDTWDFAERQPKFIVNAVRAFDLQGFDWWLPFFDAEYMAFWESVPDSLRLGERLHCDETDALFRRITGREPPEREEKAKYGAGGKRNSSIRESVLALLRRLYASDAMAGVRRRRQEKSLRRIFREEPMGWFGVFTEAEYLEMAFRGASGINAMLSRAYLDRLERASADGSA